MSVDFYANKTSGFPDFRVTFTPIIDDDLIIDEVVDGDNIIISDPTSTIIFEDVI